MADREPVADLNGSGATDVHTPSPPRTTASRSVRRRMTVRSGAARQASAAPAGSDSATPAAAPPESAAPATEIQAPETSATEAPPIEAPRTDGPRTATPSTAVTDAETPESETDEAAPDKSKPADPDRALRRSRLIVAALCVLLVAALVAVGLLGRSWYDKRQLDDAHQAALAAARQSTVNFMSISASTVDRDIQRISAGASGDFRDEFDRDAAQVRKAVVDNKVTSQGTVLRTGLVSGNTRTAVVLVAVDANVKNKAAPNGRLSHYRVRVSLTRDTKTDRWLVSQLQFVG